MTGRNERMTAAALIGGLLLLAAQGVPPNGYSGAAAVADAGSRTGSNGAARGASAARAEAFIRDNYGTTPCRKPSMHCNPLRSQGLQGTALLTRRDGDSNPGYGFDPV